MLRKTSIIRYLVLFTVLLPTHLLLATSIIGGGSLHTFPGVLNEDGTPYWDNPSMDGNQQSLGYYLSGTGGPFPEPSPGITPTWWGNSDGSADSDFYFTTSENRLHATLKLELASLKDTNEFGWYNVGSPEILNPIFVGIDGPGAFVDFSPGNDFGFYLEAEGSGTFFTQSSLNPTSDIGIQHFALFAESLVPGHSVFWIGAEDLRAPVRGIEGIGDFNDIVIRISELDGGMPMRSFMLSSETPEPSTWMMLGLGLFFIAASRLHRSK